MAQKPTPEAAIDNAAQGDNDEALRNAAGVPQGTQSTTHDDPAETSASVVSPDANPTDGLDPKQQHAPNFEESLQAERNPQPRSSDDIAANVDGIGDLDGSELQRANDVAQAQGDDTA